MNKVITLLSLVFMFSCSKESSKTSANFQLTFGAVAGTPIDFQGGLLVIGYSTSNNDRFSRVLTDISASEEIPNGNWNFEIFGWDQVPGGYHMAGKVYCGGQSNVILNGSEVDINIVVSNDNCQKYGATNNGSEYKFDSFNFQACNNLTSITSASQNCEYDLANDIYTKGYASSIRIVAESYNKFEDSFQNLNSSLNGNCLDFDSTSDTSSISGGDDNYINFPIFSSTLPSEFKLEVFYSSNCDNEKGKSDVIVQTGPNNQDNDSKVLKDGMTHKVFFKNDENDICSGQRFQAIYTGDHATKNEFAGGNGTTSLPFFICSPEQFNMIGEKNSTGSPTYNNKSFKVLKDLNFNLVRKASIDALGLVRTAPICAGLSDSIVPISGYTTTDISDITTGGPATPCPISGNSSTPFVANFDGSNKILKGIALGEVANIENASLFGRVGASSIIKNIVIEDINIKGSKNVASLVGSSNGTSVNLKNISIKNAKISSQDGNAAGVIATSSTGTLNLKNISIKKLNVDASNSSAQDFSASGLLGEVPTGSPTVNIEDIYINGQIKTNNTGSLDSYIGGVLGRHNFGNANLKNIYTSGVIDVNGGSKDVYLGGIASKINDSSVGIEDLSSNMFLKASGNNVYAGGIIGDGSVTGGPSIENHKFTGKFKLFGTTGHASDPLTLSTALCPSPAISTTASSCTFSTFTGSIVGNFTNYSGEYVLNIKKIYGDHCNTINDYESVANQNAIGRGIATDPIVLCNSGQLQNIKDYKSANYIIGDHINVGSLDVDVDTPSSFSGTIDGNNYTLYNVILQTSGSASGNLGFINDTTSSAIIKNINFDTTLNSFSLDPSSNVGLVVGNNNGTIENVSLISSIDELNISNIANLTKFGAITGINNGNIINTEVRGSASVDLKFASIAFENYGLIELAHSKIEIQMGAQGPYEDIAGMVFKNAGTINESWFQGKMINGGSNSNAGFSSSAFVVDNEGTIQNSLVSAYDDGGNPSIHISIGVSTNTIFSLFTVRNTGTIDNNFVYVKNSSAINANSDALGTGSARSLFHPSGGVTVGADNYVIKGDHLTGSEVNDISNILGPINARAMANLPIALLSDSSPEVINYHVERISGGLWTSPTPTPIWVDMGGEPVLFKLEMGKE